MCPMMWPILSNRVSEKVLGCVLFPVAVRGGYLRRTTLETPTCEFRKARELDAVANIPVKDVVALYRTSNGILRPDQRRASEGIKEGNLFHPDNVHQVGFKGLSRRTWPARDEQSFIYRFIPDATRGHVPSPNSIN